MCSSAARRAKSRRSDAPAARGKGPNGCARRCNGLPLGGRTALAGGQYGARSSKELGVGLGAQPTVDRYGARTAAAHVAHAQLRIVAQERIGSDGNGVHVRAPAVGVASRRLAGYPARIATARRNAPVQRLRQFEDGVRSLLGAMGDIGGVQLGRLLAQEARFDGDPVPLHVGDAASVNARVGIS